MMNYKGYTGVLRVDTEAGVLRGHVVDTRDVITFQGKTIEEATTEFRASVDDYLEFCASLGQSPEKPFSGTFLVRLKSKVHRDLTAVAHSKGVSVNKLVSSELTRLARRNSHEKPMKPEKPMKGVKKLHDVGARAPKRSKDKTQV